MNPFLVAVLQNTVEDLNKVHSGTVAKIDTKGKTNKSTKEVLDDPILMRNMHGAKMNFSMVNLYYELFWTRLMLVHLDLHKVHMACPTTSMSAWHNLSTK
ncbi:hypothetical protein L195_g007712, partial [Trifolium pratense]